MKTALKSSIAKSAVLVAAMLTFASVTASAQLTYAGEYLQNTINTATGTDPTSYGDSYNGYIFFAPGSGAVNDLYSVPGFVTLGAFVGTSGAFSSSYAAAVTDGNAPTFAPDTGLGNANNRYGGAYSSITINGTLYKTGVDYKNGTAGTSAASPTTLGAIELTSGVPSSFNVGFLLDNTGTNGGQFDQDVSLTLETSGGTALSTVNLESSMTGGAANNFYYANVSDAVAGDYLVLTAYNVGSPAPPLNVDVTVGGIVFSEAATPEPSTWALFGAGLIAGLAFLIKRKRQVSALQD